MKKRLAVVMALVLLCGCIFAACSNDDNPTQTGDGTSAAPQTSAVPIAVSVTEYLYATNPDGSFETVIATDAEGNTRTYLKGVRPAATDAASADDPAETMFEISNSDVVSSFIEILNSGAFEMDGYITTDGEKMPLSFSCYEKNVRMGTEIEGIALDFAIVDGVTYLISDNSKSYIELTDTIKRSLGFDDDSISFDGFGTISNDATVRSDATYNGKAVDCYTATSADGDIKFYVDGESLVKIEMYTPDGVCSTMIETTLVRGGLTLADLQVPADYEKKNYVAFVADLMGV